MKRPQENFLKSPTAKVRVLKSPTAKVRASARTFRLLAASDFTLKKSPSKLPLFFFLLRFLFCLSSSCSSSFGMGFRRPDWF